MARDAEIIPMHRSIRSTDTGSLRRAVGDGILWEEGHRWSGPGALSAARCAAAATDVATPAEARRQSALAQRPRRERSAGPSLRVRRRRAVLMMMVAATVVTLLALPLRVLAGASVAPAASTPTLRQGQVYVVRSGDTLWGIAQRLDPTADPAVAVSRMEQRLGTDTVYPGERIALP